MSTEEGTITKVSENTAWVKVRRSSMCNTCNHQRTCLVLGGGETMEAEALNTAGAQVGDRVLLKIPSTLLVKVSFIFYMIPVIFLISGVILGMKMARYYSLEPELGAMIMGILGCVLAFLIIRLFAKKAQKNKDYVPEVIKII
jgi:sigma-E factor negative regulatory protein RseC